MKLRTKILTGVVLGLALIEIGIRISGIIDFPLYDADNHIGYIPKPNQSGSFLRTHDWQFNSLSMGATEFRPTDKDTDTLLIGDSIVLGGNPYKQGDRLGPQLQLIHGGNVWPISAGSWALRNELVYLNLHPKVVAAVDELIFVLNSGDFAEASSWACEETHPRSYPIYATTYVVKKYIYNWNSCGAIPSEFKVTKGDWRVELRRFLQSEHVMKKKVSFFLYPDKEEISNDKLMHQRLELHSIELAAVGANKIYSVGRDPRWNSDLYRDGIHPTERGTKALALIIDSPLDRDASSNK